MSYAYDQLRLSMQYLAQSGPLHERLAKALSEILMSLRPKDLPSACRSEFGTLMNKFSLPHNTSRRKTLITQIRAVSEQEAHVMAQTIIFLFDTVTRYQPLPALETAQQ